MAVFFVPPDALEHIPTDALKWSGLAFSAIGLATAIWALFGDPSSLPNRYYIRYTTYLGRRLRQQFLRTSVPLIVFCQVTAFFLTLTVGVLFNPPYWYLALVPVLIGPAVRLEEMRKKRITAIENQLDGFLLALSNALRATPSLGDAFSSIQYLVAPPLRQEVELASKEMRIGATLDQALRNMAARIGGRQVDSALSAILIGRQVGGSLPKVLQTTAATIREMTRLDGVVRAKTAEARAQMWVLAVFPAFIIGTFHYVQPGYFEPLSKGAAGYIASTIAGACWAASLIVARTVLTVDI